MKRFKAILFDFDDTLVNSFNARLMAAQQATQLYMNKSPKLDLERIMKESAGRPQLEIWRDVAGDNKKAAALMESYKDCYWRKETKMVTLFPGIRGVLDSLKPRQIVLGIVTSKVRLLNDWEEPYGAAIELKRVGCETLFDLVVGWEDVEKSKPAPDPILYAIDNLDVLRNEVLMVGDSHIDIIAAKRAGVVSAGALWGTLAKDLLLEARPDYLLDSPSDILALVD